MTELTIDASEITAALRAPRRGVHPGGRRRADRSDRRSRRRDRTGVGPARRSGQRAARVRGRHVRAWLSTSTRTPSVPSSSARSTTSKRSRSSRRPAGSCRCRSATRSWDGSSTRAGRADRRQGPHQVPRDRRMEVQAPGIVDRQPVSRADADGHQGDRRHDPDRPRPARADHRRPQDRQDHRRRRHDHQPARPGREVHLRRHRPEELVGRPDGEATLEEHRATRVHGGRGGLGR